MGPNNFIPVFKKISCIFFSKVRFLFHFVFLFDSCHAVLTQTSFCVGWAKSSKSKKEIINNIKHLI